MRTNIVFTFIGDDMTGLVEHLSTVVGGFGGNWLESRLVRLSGKFAGIVRVSVETTRADELTAAVRKAAGDKGLTAVVESAAGEARPAAPQRRLAVLGLDRPGIVNDISRALHAQMINVIELNTNLTRAAMTGEPLFEADALVECPADTEFERLQDALDAISEALGIDIDLADTTP